MSVTAPPSPNNTFELEDPIGYLAHGIYTPLSLCFALPPGTTQSEITNELTQGAERLSASFPWLTGQVVAAPNDSQSVARRPKTIPLERTIRVIVKDYSKGAPLPSMADLKEAHFPSRMLDGTLLTSLTGAPHCFGDPDKDPCPVFFIQANFIDGGLILTLAGEHSAMDGQGLGAVMQLFSKACCDEGFTDEELRYGNRYRLDVVPVLDQEAYKPGPELEPLLVQAVPVVRVESTVPARKSSSWVYVHFPSSSLKKLKSMASASLNGVPYITSNDAISAFIWKAVSRVRSERTQTPGATSTFARAVDVRPHLSIPPSYPGVLSSHTYSTLSFTDISSKPLGHLASILRQALNPEDVAYTMRSLVTYIGLDPSNMSKIRYGAKLDLSKDIFFSSWTQIPCYDLHFGLGLGHPEAVRRARFNPIEGLMYLMPMDRSGGVDAAICLSDEDLERLRCDKEFMHYGKWIG
ncbi:putative trichothecene 3-O-acetyltransferase [Ephemerocybe angulata]|uniref:Putative trichothecene 3-O-acetyltransferase n=1 Tax=Ephemerocybe angulata TaxID=980116 RepID=A0A8H6M5C6_9AGAR|nr:putative trichothecene 3-O-acetyltransferase [Tulosesus angulatus]